MGGGCGRGVSPAIGCSPSAAAEPGLLPRSRHRSPGWAVGSHGRPFLRRERALPGSHQGFPPASAAPGSRWARRDPPRAENRPAEEKELLLLLYTLLLLLCMLLLLLRLLAAGRAPAGMDGWMDGENRLCAVGLAVGCPQHGGAAGGGAGRRPGPAKLGQVLQTWAGGCACIPLGERPPHTESYGAGRPPWGGSGIGAGDGGHSRGALRLEGRTSE